MKSYIEKVDTFDHHNLVYLKEYFNNFKNSEELFPGVMIFTLYKKNDFKRYEYNKIDDLYESQIKNKIDNIVLDKIYELVDYVKELYDIDILWLRFYNPKTFIEFHMDETSNKHCITLNGDERFFNYESSKANYADNILYTKKIKEYSNDIDKFNEFFVNHNPEHNRIVNIESNSVYCFNYSLHSFYNGSDKLRVNLIFEKEDTRYHKK